MSFGHWVEEGIIQTCSGWFQMYSYIRFSFGLAWSGTISKPLPDAHRGRGGVRLYFDSYDDGIAST